MVQPGKNHDQYGLFNNTLPLFLIVSMSRNVKSSCHLEEKCYSENIWWKFSVFSPEWSSGAVVGVCVPWCCSWNRVVVVCVGCRCQRCAVQAGSRTSSCWTGPPTDPTPPAPWAGQGPPSAPCIRAGSGSMSSRPSWGPSTTWWGTNSTYTLTELTSVPDEIILHWSHRWEMYIVTGQKKQ